MGPWSGLYICGSVSVSSANLARSSSLVVVARPAIRRAERKWEKGSKGGVERRESAAHGKKHTQVHHNRRVSLMLRESIQQDAHMALLTQTRRPQRCRSSPGPSAPASRHPEQRACERTS